MPNPSAKTYLQELANLHLREFKGDFLPSLGIEFLTQLYYDLFTNNRSVFIVETNKHKIVGYVIGVYHASNLISSIIRRRFLRYSLLLIPAMIKKPDLFLNILETFRYSKKSDFSTSDVELLVIAVIKQHRRHNIGSKLLRSLEKRFIQHNVRDYRVSVNASNKIAQSFYQKHNFKKKREFTMYQKKWHLYTKTLLLGHNSSC